MAISFENGKHRAIVHIGGSKVDSKWGFSSERAAKKWHDERKAELRGQDPRALVEAGRLTFDDLLERFEKKHIPSLRSERSRDLYTAEIRLRIRPFFEYRKLKSITPELIMEFRDGFVDQPKVGNYCLGVLRNILNRAKAWKMIPASPFPEDFDWLEEEEAEIRWWDSPDDIQKFLDVAKAKSVYYPLFLLGLETGMRYGELAGLWKSDIDFDRGRIHVQRQWHSKAKSGKHYGLPKWGKKRWIDFDPQGQLAVELKKAKLASKSDLMFPSKTGRPHSYDKVLKGFDRVIIRAKVPKIGLHGLRHTFASWYVKMHDDIWALSAMLGHSSVTTTERIYAHHSERAKKKHLSMAQVISTQASAQETPNFGMARGGKGGSYWGK